MAIRAVITTGIYCRAGCAGRPLEKNVRPFRSTVEALAAGFRPCLLCRPDRLAGTIVEQPAAEIAHALRLISEGFLDSHTTEQLAARIGYSSRQLVRLFEHHVGASPDFVARARRAHMARRLLDESGLSISKIAFASGFQSIRQMNRVMRELFGFSPSELRSKRLRGDPLNPLDGGFALRVPYEGPFEAERSIRYLGSRSIPGVEATEDGVYRRAIITCGFPGVVEVRAGEGRWLEVTMHLATIGSIIDEVQRVRSLFRLEGDAAPAEKALRRDPILGRLVRRRPGLRLPGSWDRFETAIRIIVGQQISVAGASTIAGRIAQRCGQTFDLDLPGGLTQVFPTAEMLADADLKDLGLTTARAKTIHAFAKAVAEGQLDLTRPGALDDTCETLESLPGIGPWTSHLVAARAMGHGDAFASSDLGLRKAGARLLGRTEPLSAWGLEGLAKDWRPFRTTAMAYLWMSSEQELQKPTKRNRTRSDRRARA